MRLVLGPHLNSAVLVDGVDQFVERPIVLQGGLDSFDLGNMSGFENPRLIAEGTTERVDKCRPWPNTKRCALVSYRLPQNAGAHARRIAQ